VKSSKRFSASTLVLIIFSFGFLIYLNILPNKFVWDDEEQIINNPYIKSFTSLPAIFQGSTFNTGGAGLSGWYFKPIMSLWFMVNYRLWGLNPSGFHLAQIFLHLINSAMVFLIFEQLFSSYGRQRARLTAFFSAIIFVVHPVNVESVAYISGSQEGLYTFFLLLIIFLLTSKDLFFKKTSYFGTLGLGFFLFLSGLLSKESAIVAIPVVFLLLLVLKQRLKEAYFWLVGSFGSLFLYFFWRTLIAKVPIRGSSAIIPIAKAGFDQRLKTVPFELFSYLRLTFWPMKLSIAQHQVVKTLTDIRFWGTLPLVIIFFVGLFWGLLKLKNKLAWFFFIWWSVSLSLILNLFPLDMTIAERWLYFPLIGFLGLIAVFILEATKKMKFRQSWALLIIPLVFFSIRTFRRTFDWRNGLTLFGHDIKYSFDSFDLENNLGTELFRAGRVEEAWPHFEKSIELESNWWTAYNNLGVVYQRKGNFDLAKKFYRRAIENGDYYLAYENLASVMLTTESLEKTIDFTESALGKLPFNLNLRTVLIVACSRKGENEKAAIEARKLYQLSPTPQTYQLYQAVLRKEKL
jgi:hypothetical protein